MGKSIAKKTARRSLTKKGFTEKVENPKSDHYVFYYTTLSGRATDIHTKISRGTKPPDIDQSLLGQIKRQLNLSSIEDTYLFLKCDTNQEEYETDLIDRGIL